MLTNVKYLTKILTKSKIIFYLLREDDKTNKKMEK